MNELEITRCLTLSTSHISEETANLLFVPSGMTNKLQDVLNIRQTEYGCWIYISEEFFSDIDDDLYNKTPKDLWNCILLAEEHDCQWLQLDSDGCQTNLLPVYDW